MFEVCTGFPPINCLACNFFSKAEISPKYLALALYNSTCCASNAEEYNKSVDTSSLFNLLKYFLGIVFIPALNISLSAPKSCSSALWVVILSIYSLKVAFVFVTAPLILSKFALST